MIRDFISLLFPQICASCGKALFKSEHCICTYCRYHLPKTDYHQQEDNPVNRLFWGRTDIRFAASYYFFRKGNKVQRLIHKLKYMGQQEIGLTIGRFYGSELCKSEHFKSIDCIIPVPLHALKKRRRGYNQSDSFGMGLARSMGKPCYTDNLYRAIANVSQTRKNQWERFKNVEGIFRLRMPALLRGKYILLVDDVITTGSTIEACSKALQQVPGVQIAVATIACAMQ